MYSTMKIMYRVGLACGVCAALPAVAVAQAANNGSQTLEEIVITAQKRAENLQDVPISVAAFTRRGS